MNKSKVKVKGNFYRKFKDKLEINSVCSSTRGIHKLRLCDPPRNQSSIELQIGLHRISAPALANPKAGHFSQIGFGQISSRIWQTP